jgi:hypothetical protein
MSELVRVMVHGTEDVEPLSLGVIQAVAKSKGVDPDELEFAIADFVDLSALSNVFASDTSAARRGMVAFTVEDRYVTVDVGRDDDAEITVEPTPKAQSTTPAEQPATSEVEDRL